MSQQGGEKKTELAVPNFSKLSAPYLAREAVPHEGSGLFGLNLVLKLGTRHIGGGRGRGHRNISPPTSSLQRGGGVLRCDMARGTAGGG